MAYSRWPMVRSSERLVFCHKLYAISHTLLSPMRYTSPFDTLTALSHTEGRTTLHRDDRRDSWILRDSHSLL